MRFPDFLNLGRQDWRFRFSRSVSAMCAIRMGGIIVHGLRYRTIISSSVYLLAVNPNGRSKRKAPRMVGALDGESEGLGDLGFRPSKSITPVTAQSSFGGEWPVPASTVAWVLAPFHPDRSLLKAHFRIKDATTFQIGRYL